MQDLTEEQLFDLVDTTMKWATEVADLWTGTLYEKQIEAQKEQINKALEENDLKRAQSLVFDLAQFLEHAESEYNRADAS